MITYHIHATWYYLVEVLCELPGNTVEPARLQGQGVHRIVQNLHSWLRLWFPLYGSNVKIVPYVYKLLLSFDPVLSNHFSIYTDSDPA